MTATDETSARAGSPADLSRRMDRLELNHEALTREVASLTSTVSRVEINQSHAEELNKLRFNALDTSVSNLSADLKTFMARIEGMIDGTVETTASRQGAELVADYQKWRREVDAFIARTTFLGRIAVIVLGGQALLILASLAAVVKP